MQKALVKDVEDAAKATPEVTTLPKLYLCCVCV